jgi:L-aspartate oxidase
VKSQIVAGTSRGLPPAPLRFTPAPPPQALRDAMARHVGLERDAAGLTRALATIGAIERASGGEPALLNVIAATKLVTAAALARKESRGAHFRLDYPQTESVGQRTFFTLADAELIARSTETDRSDASRTAL